MVKQTPVRVTTAASVIVEIAQDTEGNQMIMGNEYDIIVTAVNRDGRKIFPSEVFTYLVPPNMSRQSSLL